VLYHLGRAGERFVVGDGPVDLGREPRPVHVGRREDASSDVQVLVDDPWMSSVHARVVDGARGSGRLFLEDCGSRNGILVNGTRAERAPLLHGDIIEMGRTFWVFVEERGAEPLSSSPAEFGALATWHPRFGQQLLQLSARSTSMDHVLVAGPPGSGRGFIARTLHQVSRREGRMVHLDCREHGPRNVGAELFGVDGAPGKLGEAARGTLLLEHVDKLAADAQVRLAEALRRRAYPQTRVVATVDAAVDGLVAAGALTRALVDVVGTLRVDTPALDERLCDLGILLDEFMARARGAVAIDREACRLLFRHRFTQNVRGFGRVVEAASSLAVDDDRRRKGGMIEVTHLPFCVAGVDTLRALLSQANHLAGEADVGLTGEHHAPSFSEAELPVPEDSTLRANAFSSVIHTDAEASMPLPVKLASPWRKATVGVGFEAPLPLDPVVDVNADALVAALRGARGNVSAAARTLGRPRALVLRWLRDLNIDPSSYR
jgi:DNA-binding NtrC family response regulator